MDAAINRISAVITNQTSKAQHQNTLAFCVDNNYLPFALFVANQFIDHHSPLPCDICICMSDISQVPKALLTGTIRFIEMAITGIDHMPVGSLSLAAYYRLFLPRIFAQTYDYIIYLDADTYINRPFYDDMMACCAQFPSNFCVAAAADIIELKFKSTMKPTAKKVDHYVRGYHQFDHVYRNSGVLLLNTKNYNYQQVLIKVFSYAFTHADKLQCHDQSALNGALLNDIVLLPFNFNWQIHTLTYKLTQEFNPYILHFISNNKPWVLKNKFTKDYQSIYHNYLVNNFPKQTPQVLNVYEYRKKSPKYSNPAREFVSIKGHQLRDGLAAISKAFSISANQGYGCQKILPTPPFLVSKDIKPQIANKKE